MNNRMYKKLSSEQIKEVIEKTNASVEAKKRYRENTKQFAVEFNMKTESDLVEHLLKQSNKQGYIKNLIKEDMRKSGK